MRHEITSFRVPSEHRRLLKALAVVSAGFVPHKVSVSGGARHAKISTPRLVDDSPNTF